MAWYKPFRVRGTRVVFRGKPASPKTIQEAELAELQREVRELRQELVFLIAYPTQEATHSRIARLSKAVAAGAEILDPADPFTSDGPGEELLKLLAHAKRRGFITED